MPAEQEVQMLRNHADALKTQLDQISTRLEELEQTES
jgi:prefoldin subunit 5